jgi:predicted amidophosphoribosyltransferase
MGLLDLVLPQRCLVCSSPGGQLCVTCLDGMPRIEPPLCARCGAPTAWPVARCRECAGRRLAFGSARAAVGYDDAVRRLVACWKEGGLRGAAAIAAELVVAAVPRPAVDALAPVPPERERLLRRGHHPATRLSAELGRRWDLPAEPLLDRPGAAPAQRGLSLAERRRNVRGAFAARASPRRVALVDDVYTSGSTAAAAASALRRAGAREVVVVTFARALRGYTVGRPIVTLPGEREPSCDSR